MIFFKLVTSHFSLASEVVRCESYVDDFLSTSFSIEEGLREQQEIIFVLRMGGLKLEKWAADFPELLEWLAPAESNWVFVLWQV